MNTGSDQASIPSLIRQLQDGSSDPLFTAHALNVALSSCSDLRGFPTNDFVNLLPVLMATDDLAVPLLSCVDHLFSLSPRFVEHINIPEFVAILCNLLRCAECQETAQSVIKLLSVLSRVQPTAILAAGVWDDDLLTRWTPFLLEHDVRKVVELFFNLCARLPRDQFDRILPALNILPEWLDANNKDIQYKAVRSLSCLVKLFRKNDDQLQIIFSEQIIKSLIRISLQGLEKNSSDAVKIQCLDVLSLLSIYSPIISKQLLTDHSVHTSLGKIITIFTKRGVTPNQQYVSQALTLANGLLPDLEEDIATFVNRDERR
eukprot:TRINITY_DN5815_c2_g1_i6.p1 TRINITY_DN5815_c2_g1~~TRINITY_DN5815_c2_g1_i6.p1  ORF type:complete len:354 (-),score=48.10 TRINITY_DN5815_c2_g1_i6:52-1002(-)